MRGLVTGGAGFIGSHLCDRLIDGGHTVWCVDNMHLGRRRNIRHLEGNPQFRFVEMDVRDEAALDALFAEARFDGIFHLAANSDIRAGNADPRLDAELNFVTTLAVLNAARVHKVPRLFFASTSAVIGEAPGRLREDHGPLLPISPYGASKMAAEAYLSVYAHTYDLATIVFRFPNVVGERLTHGAIFDFIAKLKADPSRLEVLGDGSQMKPYLYVGDLVDAIMLAWDRAPAGFNLYHVAGIGQTSVTDIARAVIAVFGAPDCRIGYTGGDRGWPGDVPKFEYDTSRIEALGWRPKYDSGEAIAVTLRRIVENGF